MLGGCPPRDCINREGPKWLHERVYNDREAELQPRVDRRRVRLATFARGDLAGSLAAFDAFAREIRLLAQPDRDDEPLEQICEAVATTRAVR
jgi:hypothetical protein